MKPPSAKCSHWIDPARLATSTDGARLGEAGRTTASRTLPASLARNVLENSPLASQRSSCKLPLRVNTRHSAPGVWV